MAEMMEHAQEVENNENAVLNMSGAFEIEKLTVRSRGNFATIGISQISRKFKFSRQRGSAVFVPFVPVEPVYMYYEVFRWPAIARSAMRSALPAGSEISSGKKRSSRSATLRRARPSVFFDSDYSPRFAPFRIV